MPEPDPDATALRLALTLATVAISHDPTVADEEQLLRAYLPRVPSDAERAAAESSLAPVRVLRAHAWTVHD